MVLSQNVQSIYHVLSFPVVQNNEWKSIHAAMKQLAECPHVYTERLKIENEQQKGRQSSLEPVWSPLDVYVIERVPIVSS